MITADTLAAARRSRINLDRVVDAEVNGLRRAWSLAWSEIAHEWDDAVDELIAAGDGGWPTRRQVLRAERAQQALTYAADRLDELGKGAGESIAGRVRDLIASSEFWQRQMVKSSIKHVGFKLEWNRVDTRAVEAIIVRAGQQIESLAATLSAPAQDAMRRELIRGVTVGANPRAAARRMVQRVQGRFMGGLPRAKNIATTEMIDAYRTAALESRKANQSVITGWTWLATLDRRICPSCLSLNGSHHPVAEHGPDDHQQGRCVAIPTTKTYAELGILAIEPAPAHFPDARAWFDRQSAQVQAEIMGRERLRRLKSGELSWAGLSQERTTSGWRRSYGTAPLT